MPIRRYFFGVLFLMLQLTLHSQVNENHVWVKAHYRIDGTYVPGHYRTAPNESNVDNFSTKGNTNPYTGEPGWISRDSGFKVNNNLYKKRNKDGTFSEESYYPNVVRDFIHYKIFTIDDFIHLESTEYKRHMASLNGELIRQENLSSKKEPYSSHDSKGNNNYEELNEPYDTYTKQSGYIFETANIVSPVRKVNAKSKVKVLGWKGNYWRVNLYGTIGFLHKSTIQVTDKMLQLQSNSNKNPHRQYKPVVKTKAVHAEPYKTYNTYTKQSGHIFKYPNATSPLKRISANTKITVHGQTGNYFKIRHFSTAGYLHKSMIRVINEMHQDQAKRSKISYRSYASLSATKPKQFSPSEIYTTYTKQSGYIFKSPNASSPLMKIRANSEIRILGLVDNFWEVRYFSTTGYLHQSSVKITNEMQQLKLGQQK